MTRSPFRLSRRSALAGFVLCALVAAGCGDEHSTPSAPAAGTALVGTQWVLDVSSLGVSDGSSVSSWISFEQGHVTGNDGCNGFSGSYELAGSKLTFGPLAGTQKACGGAAGQVSDKVTAALGRVRAYSVSGKTLRLKDARGEVLLTYAAGTSGVEGSWTAISVLYNDAIHSVVAGAEPTADFSAGTISGSTGCNDFHGPYTLDGKKLHVGPLSATKKACPTKEASQQEAGYLSALESAARIEQAGPELTLLNTKGQRAVTLTRR